MGYPANSPHEGPQKTLASKEPFQNVNISKRKLAIIFHRPPTHSKGNWLFVENIMSRTQMCNEHQELKSFVTKMGEIGAFFSFKLSKIVIFQRLEFWKSPSPGLLKSMNKSADSTALWHPPDVSLGCLKLILCFTSAPSYLLLEFTEKNKQIFVFLFCWFKDTSYAWS